MPKLDDIERLTLENLSLKAAAATRERDLCAAALQAKYGGAAVKSINVADGTVVMVEEMPAEPAGNGNG